MRIEVTRQLGAFDHILNSERQHSVSIAYIARHTGGEPSVREPGKCSRIGWFTLDELPTPLSMITVANVRKLRSDLSQP